MLPQTDVLLPVFGRRTSESVILCPVATELHRENSEGRGHWGRDAMDVSIEEITKDIA